MLIVRSMIDQWCKIHKRWSFMVFFAGISGICPLGRDKFNVVRTVNAKGGRLWQIRFIVGSVVIQQAAYPVWQVAVAEMAVSANLTRVQSNRNIIAGSAVIQQAAYPVWQTAVAEMAASANLTRVQKSLNMSVKSAVIQQAAYPVWQTAVAETAVNASLRVDF